MTGAYSFHSPLLKSFVVLGSGGEAVVLSVVGRRREELCLLYREGGALGAGLG